MTEINGLQMNASLMHFFVRLSEWVSSRVEIEIWWSLCLFFCWMIFFPPLAACGRNEHHTLSRVSFPFPPDQDAILLQVWCHTVLSCSPGVYVEIRLWLWVYLHTIWSAYVPVCVSYRWEKKSITGCAYWGSCFCGANPHRCRFCLWGRGLPNYWIFPLRRLESLQMCRLLLLHSFTHADIKLHHPVTLIFLCLSAWTPLLPPKVSDFSRFFYRASSRQ